MKKILFMNPWLAMGGLERVLVNLANALSERGHEVTIKTITEESTLAKYLHPAIKYEVVPQKSFWLAQKVKGVWRVLNFENWFKYSSPRTLYNYYVHEDYDVEIAFFRGYSIKIISGSSKKKARKLAWVHNDFLHCQGIATGFLSFKQVIKAYRKFDKIVCVSKQAQESFIERIGVSDTVTTIYNINPVEEICLASNEQIDLPKVRFTMVAVGRLARQKGFERLLEVCKRLNEKGFSYELWIIGDGEEKSSLKSYIMANNLDNIKLLGMQENPYKYIKASDLLVCSSHYEGYCLAVAEALILGVPVVSTKCTGPTEILDNGKYGILVENSTEGLYNGIATLISDSKLYQHYQEQAILRAPFFDPERIVSEVETLF